MTCIYSGGKRLHLQKDNSASSQETPFQMGVWWFNTIYNRSESALRSCEVT